MFAAIGVFGHGGEVSRVTWFSYAQALLLNDPGQLRFRCSVTVMIKKEKATVSKGTLDSEVARSRRQGSRTHGTRKT